MPRIPEIRPARPVTRTRPTTRFPREDLSMARDLQRGADQFGQALREVGLRMRKQERKTKIGELKNEALEKLKTMEGELSTGIITDEDGNKRKLTYEEASERADQLSDAIKTEILGNVEDDVVRQAVELDYDRMSILTKARIRTDLAKLRQSEHEDSYLVQKDLLVQRIVEETDRHKKAELRKMLLEHIAGAAAANVIDDPRQQLAEARHELAVEQMHKDIRLDPQAALERLRTGDVDQNLTETDIKELTSTARSTRNARLAETKRQEALEAKELKKRREAVGNEFVEKLHNDQLTTTEVLDSELAPTGENSKEHWLKMIEQKVKDEAAPPPNGGPMAVELLKRIYLPAGHPNKVTSMSQIESHYYADNEAERISFTDLTRLRKEFENARSEAGQRLGKVKTDFTSSLSDLINPKGQMGQILRPGGGQAMYQFERYVDEKVQEFRDNDKDPYKLFDPGSREYLGTPEVIKMFVPEKDFTTVERALGTNVSLPTRNGKINTSRLKAGTVYTLPDGRQGEWDGTAFNIVGGTGVEIPLTDEGETSLRQTTVGRPEVQNPDGSVSTERSITVTDPRLNNGKPTNIPSMLDGKQVSQEEAIKRIIEAGGKDPETGRKVRSFESIEEAVRAARKRSKQLGQGR